jgi:hypothetical protein
MTPEEEKAGVKEIARSRYAEEMVKRAVLDSIANILPFYPRDFDVEITAYPLPDTDQRYGTTISVTPKTEMGRAIHPVLKAQLQQAMSEHMKPVKVPDEVANGNKRPA